MHNRLGSIATTLVDLKQLRDAAIGTIVFTENAFFVYVIVEAHPFRVECLNWPCTPELIPVKLFIAKNPKELTKLFSIRWAQIVAQYPEVEAEKEKLVRVGQRLSWVRTL